MISAAKAWMPGTTRGSSPRAKGPPGKAYLQLLRSLDAQPYIAVAQPDSRGSPPAMSIVPSDLIGTGQKISQHREAPQDIVSARAHPGIRRSRCFFAVLDQLGPVIN